MEGGMVQDILSRQDERQAELWPGLLIQLHCRLCRKEIISCVAHDVIQTHAPVAALFLVLNAHE